MKDRCEFCGQESDDTVWKSNPSTWPEKPAKLICLDCREGMTDPKFREEKRKIDNDIRSMIAKEAKIPAFFICGFVCFDRALSYEEILRFDTYLHESFGYRSTLLVTPFLPQTKDMQEMGPRAEMAFAQFLEEWEKEYNKRVGITQEGKP